MTDKHIKPNKQWDCFESIRVICSFLLSITPTKTVVAMIWVMWFRFIGWVVLIIPITKLLSMKDGGDDGDAEFKWIGGEIEPAPY